MRLHHRGKKADWYRVLPQKRNFWQRLAELSAGVVTPGNLISIGGLLLVLLGAWLLVQQQYLAGLLMIIAGRIGDVLDGIVAEKTGTKSPLGEIVDTTADKLAILLIVPVLIIEHLLPLSIVYIILLQNIINILVAAIAKVRHIELRPSIEGKISMAASWVVVVAFSVLAIASAHEQPAMVSGLLAIAAYAALAVFLIYGYRASRNYARLVFNPRPALLGELQRVIVIVNPQSSNVQRIDRRGRELARLFPDTKITIIETTARPSQLTDHLRRELNTQTGPILMAIGGGDGTVNLVINALMELQREGRDLADVPILPLWGGNANDLAFMLNGLSSRVTLSSILNRGKLVAIHPLKIVITKGNHNVLERYAACYASFGASAYAAAELEKPTHKNNVRSSGALATFMKELRQATRAMLSASGFDAEQNGERIKIFEQVFSNGSRMAKLDRFPIKLHEKVFYRIVKSDRSTTLAFYIRQLVQGKKLGEVTNRTFHFTTRERAWAQFDGEATALAANTTVSVGLAEAPFYAVSTKLEPLDNARRQARARRLRLIILGMLLPLVLFHGWLHITNPYAAPSIVEQPYTTSLKNGRIQVTKNFTLTTHDNILARSLGYYKSGFLIIQNTFAPSHLTNTKTIQQTIDDIHRVRFDPSKPYLISGNQFSVLYPRNLGVFYNSLLDPRTARSQSDWQHRQQIYLQSALYALDAFSGRRQLTTTIVPISPRSVLLTEVHPGSQPSDTLYGMLYAFQALTQPSPYSTQSYHLQTTETATKIIHERRADLQALLQEYLSEVQDPRTGLVKRHLAVSGARDGVVRDSSFYDNVILWSTLHLANELHIKKYSPENQAALRSTIINQYWDERQGIFSDEYRYNKTQSAQFSADWLIAMPTGFLQPNNTDDRSKLARIVDYSEKNGLTKPFPIKYTAANYTGKTPAAVRWFEPNYGGNVIWSYWGAEYITLLDNLSANSPDTHYHQLAGQYLQAYQERIARYGGFPETFKPDGNFLKSFFYESILDTGWVVQYELAQYEFDHPPVFRP